MVRGKEISWRAVLRRRRWPFGIGGGWPLPAADRRSRGHGRERRRRGRRNKCAKRGDRADEPASCVHHGLRHYVREAPAATQEQVRKQVAASKRLARLLEDDAADGGADLGGRVGIEGLEVVAGGSRHPLHPDVRAIVETNA